MTDAVFAADPIRLLVAAAAGIILLLLLIIRFQFHPVLSLLISELVIGLGAGMPVPTLVNTVEKDSGFWLVSSLLEIDEKTTLKSWTMMETIIGFTGLICAAIISLFA